MRTHLSILRNNSLFSHLDDNALQAFLEITQEISLCKDEFLIREGQEAADFYVLLEGDLEVLKYDADTKTYFVVNKLHSGDTVGEMALIDKGRRSAFIRVASNAKLLKISFSDFEKLTKKNKEMNSIYLEISKLTSLKLRETTEVAAQALKREVEEYKIRVSMAKFIFYVVSLISIGAFFIEPLKILLTKVDDSSLISIPLLIVLFTVVGQLIRTSGFPLEVFGFTTKQLKKSLVEAGLFSLPLLGLILAIKWVIITKIDPNDSHKLFDPFSLVKIQTLKYWLLNVLAYSLFIPIQEIMARGAFQGLLERFLVDKRKTLQSIVISNLIFSMSHLFLSLQIAIFVFVFGLYFGWLYARSHNIIGVIFAHWLIGVWGLCVVGVPHNFVG